MSFRSFVALGDSFTEGIGDPYPDGTYQGWADRFARDLAATSPGLTYANIAIRGKLVDQVIDEQVPVAIRLAPDLVSIAAGGNDLLRPGADPDALAAAFEDAVAALRSAGCTVMLFTPLPPRTGPDWRTTRRQDLAWARTYAAPWLSRRLRGVSSGDAIQPKRPELLPL